MIAEKKPIRPTIAWTLGIGCSFLLRAPSAAARSAPPPPPAPPATAAPAPATGPGADRIYNDDHYGFTSPSPATAARQVEAVRVPARPHGLWSPTAPPPITHLCP